MHCKQLKLLGAATLAILLASCGGKKEPNPTPTNAPKINSFMANKTMVAQHETVLLSWNVENAKSVTVTQMGATSATIVDASMTLVATDQPSNAIDVDTTFKLTATAQNGTTKESSFTVTIDMNAVAVLSFNATPMTNVRRGGSVTLSWMTSGATSVTLKDGNNTLTTAMGSMATSGMYTLTQADHPDYAFQLTATNGEQTAMSQVINVHTSAAPMIVAFSTDIGTFMTAPATVMLSYQVTDATSLQLLANGAPAPGATLTNLNSGTVSVTVQATTVFELVATSPAGEDRESRTVAQTTNETEPNDDIMSATEITTGGASGALNPAADVDYYKVTVPDGGNIFASIKNSDGTCPFSISLIIYDAQENFVAGNFSTMADMCPNIDPRFDSDAASLAAGDYYVKVETDDPMTVMGMGAYTLVVVVGSPGCGNGIRESMPTAEQCDDGNTMSGDGCSSTCTFEPVATINPPGGMTTLTLGPGQEKIINVVVASAGQSIEVSTHDVGAATCTNLDTFVDLYNPAGDSIAYHSFGPDGTFCGVIQFPEDTGAAHLMTPGTYVLHVGNENQTSSTFEVTIAIIDPGCGNGGLEMGEQCDDGNQASGDGCDMNCMIEAQGMLSGPPGSMTFQGGLATMTEDDYYRVDLTATGYIELHLGSPTAMTCTPTTTDTYAEIFDSMGTRVAHGDDIFDDMGNTVSRCSQILPASGPADDFSSGTAGYLMPGTYFISVHSYNHASAIPVYELAVTLRPTGCGNGMVEPGETCDDHNTMAMDGCDANCQLEPAGTVMGPPSTNTFMGAIVPGATKIDYYRVTLTAPGFIAAETFTPNVGMCNMNTQTVMAIYDSNLMPLIGATNTPGCSQINPTGQDLLQAGTYWVLVGSDMMDIPAYAVRIRTIATGCGNTITEMGETCDDGNTMSGDGCSAMCQFEGTTVPEVEPNGDLMTATPAPTMISQTTIMQAAITPAGELDVFSFTVTGANRKAIIYTHTIAGDPNSCDAMTDTVIELQDAMGNVVDSNDDIDYSAGIFCSKIDGTDAMNFMGASMLAAGTYYVVVHAYDEMVEIPTYYLSIRFQP